MMSKKTPPVNSSIQRRQAGMHANADTSVNNTALLRAVWVAGRAYHYQAEGFQYSYFQRCAMTAVPRPWVEHETPCYIWE